MPSYSLVRNFPHQYLLILLYKTYMSEPECDDRITVSNPLQITSLLKHLIYHH